MAEDATAPKVDTVEIKKEFLKNTENQLQTFRRAVPFVTNIYWLDNYGKLFTTDSFVNRELFEESQTLYRLEQEAKDAC